MSKTNLFLLIGLTKEGRHWDQNFIDSLKSFIPNSQVYLLDLPGAGELAHIDSPLTIKSIAAKTFENYQHLFNKDDKNLLVSISLGSMVSFELIKIQRNLFDGLVMINSSFKGLSPVHKRLRPSAMKSFINIFLSQKVESKEQKTIELCSNNESKYESTRKKWITIAQTSYMTNRNVVKQLMAAAQFKAQNFPKIRHLIIASKHDRLCHYSCSQEIHKAWPGDLLLFDDQLIGHAFHVDAPELLSRAIADWYLNET